MCAGFLVVMMGANEDTGNANKNMRHTFRWDRGANDVQDRLYSHGVRHHVEGHLVREQFCRVYGCGHI